MSRPPLQEIAMFMLSRAILVLPLLLSFGTGLAGAGCVNEIDRITDCQDICGRYSDCFDSSYDVSACRSKCTDKASHSADFDQRVDECENCFDDRSCTSTAFTCTTECVTIVP